MSVGLDDGFGEPLFAACFVFAVIVRSLPTHHLVGRLLGCSRACLLAHQVMYDASGVRLHAGKQAEARSHAFATSNVTLRGVADVLHTLCSSRC